MSKKATAKGNLIWAALESLRQGMSRNDAAASAEVTTSTLSKWEKKYASLESRDALEVILNPEDNRYVSAMRELFERYKPGSEGFDWERSELDAIARKIGFATVLNLGDNIFAIRHGRDDLPREVRALAPPGKAWLLLPNGRSAYRFILVDRAFLDPDPTKEPIKIPDSTPQIVSKNAMQDEQAVLARIRYCRLVDIFLGLASFQLQSHMRTTIAHFKNAQAELDEIYVGIDAKGTQFIIPIQAKSQGERIGAIQLITDFYTCKEKFPKMVARTLAAVIVKRERLESFGEILTISIIEGMVHPDYNVTKVREEHFKLVPSSAISDDEVELYQQRFIR